MSYNYQYNCNSFSKKVMGKLHEHSCFKEKEDEADCLIIRNSKGFDKWYQEIFESSKGDNFIYRGVSEAKFKLYTSSQRLWWERDFVRYPGPDLYKRQEYLNFLTTLLTEAKRWNKGLLEKFYENLGAKLNDFALLSLMQHYNLPTPLLDFTTDHNIALYFAFSNIQPYTSNEEIDNYVSLYIIDLKINSDRLLPPNDTTITKTLNTDELDLQFIYKKERLFVFSEINNSKELQMKTYTNTNFNIINQKGLFIFNGHPWKQISRSRTLPDTGFENIPYIKQLVSVDIHKSLKEYVLKKIESLNDDYLFPNFIEFKKQTIKKTLENFRL